MGENAGSHPCERGGGTRRLAFALLMLPELDIHPEVGGAGSSSTIDEHELGPTLLINSVRGTYVVT